MAKVAKQCWIKQSKYPEVEAAALIACQHPNVVRLVNVAGATLSLEYLEGPTLADRVAKQLLATNEAITYISELLSALKCIHDSGWLHNDISPHNIMCTPNGAMVIDFDSASQIVARQDCNMVGTIHYMAPDRLAGDPPSAASDLYSLGITIYEALAGRLPYEAETKAQIITAHHRHLFAPLQDLRPDAPQSLISLVGRLTSRQPCDRMCGYATP